VNRLAGRGGKRGQRKSGGKRAKAQCSAKQWHLDFPHWTGGWRAARMFVQCSGQHPYIVKPRLNWVSLKSARNYGR
jgi:hypothetical protein